MPDIEIRSAIPEDAGFLAWIMQEADRMGGRIGSLDLIFPGSESERLAALARLACSEEDSVFHLQRFLVATVDDERAAALAGYVPGEVATDAFGRAISHEAAALGWSDEKVDLVSSRAAQCSSGHYFHVPIPPDTLRVEWVATRPQFRGLGLNRRLHEELFEGARSDGRATAHVGTAIGNEPAIKAYLAAGFEPFAECRHTDFEAVYGHAGLVFLRRAL